MKLDDEIKVNVKSLFLFNGVGTLTRVFLWNAFATMGEVSDIEGRNFETAVYRRERGRGEKR